MAISGTPEGPRRRASCWNARRSGKPTPPNPGASHPYTTTLLRTTPRIYSSFGPTYRSSCDGDERNELLSAVRDAPARRPRTSPRHLRNVRATAAPASSPQAPEAEGVRLPTVRRGSCPDPHGATADVLRPLLNADRQAPPRPGPRLGDHQAVGGGRVLRLALVGPGRLEPGTLVGRPRRSRVAGCPLLALFHEDGPPPNRRHQRLVLERDPHRDRPCLPERVAACSQSLELETECHRRGHGAQRKTVGGGSLRCRSNR
jgi:hypothetical protein